MGILRTNPNYLQDSIDFAAKAQAMHEEALAKAKQLLSDNAEAAALTMVSLLAHEEPVVRFNSAKHILKLVGLEIEKAEQTNTVLIKITEEHAQKVLNAGLN